MKFGAFSTFHIRFNLRGSFASRESADTTHCRLTTTTLISLSCNSIFSHQQRPIDQLGLRALRVAKSEGRNIDRPFTSRDNDITEVCPKKMMSTCFMENNGPTHTRKWKTLSTMLFYKTSFSQVTQRALQSNETEYQSSSKQLTCWHLLGTPDTSFNGRRTRKARSALTSNALMLTVDKTTLNILQTFKRQNVSHQL